MPAWFYVLRLQSGSLYIGATTDLEKRYEEHCSRKGCRTTVLDPPIALLYSEKFETFAEVRQREAQVKRWSRAKKEALVSGDIAKLQKLAKSRKGLKGLLCEPLFLVHPHVRGEHEIAKRIGRSVHDVNDNLTQLQKEGFMKKTVRKFTIV